MQLGRADHVWQEKRSAIAASVDSLGDQFRPAMRAGWLTYIRNNYPEGSEHETTGPAIGKGALVLGDNGWSGAAAAFAHSAHLSNEYAPE